MFAEVAEDGGGVTSGCCRGNHIGYISLGQGDNVELCPPVNLYLFCRKKNNQQPFCAIYTLKFTGSLVVAGHKNGMIPRNNFIYTLLCMWEVLNAACHVRYVLFVQQNLTDI